MPSIHRQPSRPYWFCAFSIWNPETLTSRRVFRSTKTRDKKQALEICRAWHKAALKARNGKLNEDSARAIIAQGVSDVLMAANAESLPSASIKAWCDTWLQAKAIEAEPSTHDRYKRIVERFTDFLGAKAKRDLSTLQASDITRFRDGDRRHKSSLKECPRVREIVRRSASLCLLSREGEHDNSSYWDAMVNTKRSSTRFKSIP